jgi:cell pole-organizing protein PopZ
MAEKNTLSILETIKKKMHKFDQKTDAATKAADVGDEFEYINPSKNGAAKNTFAATNNSVNETNAAKNTMPNFEDDLDLDDDEELDRQLQNASNSAQQKIVPPAVQSQSHEEEHDLDLDDENNLTHNQPNQVKEVLDRIMEGENFSEEEFEDYEDEVEIHEDDDMHEIIGAVAAEHAPLHPKPQQAIDDLNLDDLDLEETHEEKHETHSEENKIDDLSLEDLDLEDEETPAQPAEKHEEHHETAADAEDKDLSFADLEEEVKHETEAEHTKEPHDPLDDISLEELENDAAKAAEKPVAKVAEASTHKEIDLEFEKELMGLKPVETAPTHALPKMEDFVALAPVAPQSVIPQIIPQEITKTAPEIIMPKPPETPAPQPVKEELKWDLEDNFSLDEAPVSAPLSAPIVEEKTVNSEIQTSPIEKMPSFENKEKKSDKLVSDITLHQTTESIKKLIDAKNMVSGISSFAQGSAFTELAANLMEPKLEKWLNEHLSELVEKIVREEIKKIISKE